MVQLNVQETAENGASIRCHSDSFALCHRLCRNGEKVLESPKERLPSPVFSTVLGNQTHQDHIILQLNVSYPGVWYIQTQKWEILTVGKKSLSMSLLPPSATLSLWWPIVDIMISSMVVDLTLHELFVSQKNWIPLNSLIQRFSRISCT